MFYFIKIRFLCVFCLMLITFSSVSCSTASSKKSQKEGNTDNGALINDALRNIKDQSYIEALLQDEDDSGKYLDIDSLYEKMSPDFIVFDDFFKSSLPNKAYRIYSKNIDKKIESLKLVSSKVKYRQGNIYSKQKVSSRKKKVKKEWIWGRKKEKMIEYYKFFRKPSSIYEYKMIFNPVKKPLSKEKDEDNKEGEEDKKIDKTTQAIVIFIYQRKKDKSMYIIDPDIFIDSIL